MNAHRINQGVIPDLRKPEAESGFYFVEADDPETAVPRIVELAKTPIPRRFGLNPIRDVQVLCPMNWGGSERAPSTSNCRPPLIPPGTARWNGSGGPSRPAD